MSDLSQIELNSTTYNLKDTTARKYMLYYATGTGTTASAWYDSSTGILISATSTAWKATISEIGSYYDGLMIAYKIPINDSYSFGISFEINSLGKHPIVRNSSSGELASLGPNDYKKDSVVLLVYCSSISDYLYNNSANPTSVSGCWVLVNNFDSGNTHYTAYIRAGASNSTSNAATTSGNTYLNLVENSTRRSGVKLVPGTNMSITSDASGNVTFNASEPQGLYFGTCSTDGGTAAKTVSITGITSYYTGLNVRILFTAGQTSSSAPSLNINNLGAVAIYRTSGIAAERYEWRIGEVVDFVYDGTHFIIADGGLATAGYPGIVRISSSIDSQSEDYVATSKAVNNVKNLIYWQYNSTNDTIDLNFPSAT